MACECETGSVIVMFAFPMMLLVAFSSEVKIMEGTGGGTPPGISCWGRLRELG